MTMSHPPLEKLNPLQIRQIRVRIMTSSNDYKIEQFDTIFFCVKLCMSHFKFGLLFNPLNVSYGAVEFNVLSKALFLESFHEISFVNLSRKIRRYWFSEMVLKSIIRKLKRFFWEVGPQLTVHTWVNMFAIFVSGTPPCVIPLSTPIWLFF